MLTKLRDILTTVVGTIVVLTGVVLTAIVGVVGFFVAAFFLWGLAAIACITGVAFLAHGMVTELREDRKKNPPSN